MDIQIFEKLLRKEVSFFSGNGKEDSANFLIWFLHNYFRLDVDLAVDLVCDHKNDKGIDGIYIDEESEEVFLFQTKYRESFNKGEGDTSLREFVGAKQWFTPENVKVLNNSSASQDLKRLVSDQRVFSFIDQGYSIKLIFVTTGYFNKNAKDYLKVVPLGEYWDCKKLYSNYTYSGVGDFVKDTCSFRLDLDPLKYSVGKGTPYYIFSLRAIDLLRLKGIADRTLFAKNVRYGLGKTRVNRDIEKTIRDNKSHKNFILYHNGITLIADKVTYDPKTKNITIKNYSIVNGCQSTLSLYENRDFISGALKLVVKVIETGQNTRLGETITYYANNQNPIDLRDLRSRDKLQTDLQKRFKAAFKNKLLYKIKTGESEEGYDAVIENNFAAQLIYSFMVGNPHDAHLKTKVFNNYYNIIFTRKVDVFLIYFLYTLFNLIEKNSEKIKNPIIATYKPTKFFILYVIKKIMEEDSSGKSFFLCPERFISTFNKKYLNAFDKLIQILIIELNLYVEQHTNKVDGYIDYKNLLRNEENIKEMANNIIAAYRILLVHHDDDKLESLLK